MSNIDEDNWPHGHCDTCGAACDGHGCVADRSHTAASEFVPEYTEDYIKDNIGITVGVSKIGGGSVGNKYEGGWAYRVTNENGKVIFTGSDIYTGTAHTHSWVANLLMKRIDG